MALSGSDCKICMFVCFSVHLGVEAMRKKRCAQRHMNAHTFIQYIHTSIAGSVHRLCCAAVQRKDMQTDTWPSTHSSYTYTHRYLAACVDFVLLLRKVKICKETYGQARIH
jgi:hypothetical protein